MNNKDRPTQVGSNEIAAAGQHQELLPEPDDSSEPFSLVKLLKSLIAPHPGDPQTDPGESDPQGDARVPLGRKQAVSEKLQWLPLIKNLINGGSRPDQTEEEKKKERRANMPGRILAVLISVGITVGILLARDQIKHFSAYGYPGIFLINLIGNATIFFPAPAFAAVFAAGSAMNPIALGIVAGLGSALGEMTGYLAGVGGRSVIENRELYDQLEAWMRKAGVLAIFVLAVIPNPAFDVGGMVAGALRMPVYRFLLACWAGKSIRLGLIALAGLAIIGS